MPLFGKATTDLRIRTEPPRIGRSVAFIEILVNSFLILFRFLSGPFGHARIENLASAIVTMALLATALIYLS